MAFKKYKSKAKNAAPLFKNKYRIPSARLQGYDYGKPGAYFITMNVHNHRHLFGKIVDGKLIPTPSGKFAEQCWAEIPKHFPHIKLGSYIIMPNHFHGILIITEQPLHRNGSTIHEQPPHCNGSTIPEQPPHCNGSTIPEQPLHCNGSSGKNKSQNIQYSKISPKPGSISTIIRSFKSQVTKLSRPFQPNFNWQTRYYDIIIRDKTAYDNISRYIENNPKKWEEDRFFSKDHTHP